MNRLVEQIGSGRKFLTPADDPLAAALSINVAQTQSMNAVSAQPQHGQDQSGTGKQCLDSVTTALSDAYPRGAGRQRHLPDSDRQALSTALKSARERCSAGQQHRWQRYMFSGLQGSAAPTRRTRRPDRGAPPANAPFRLINRARCPPATWARISSAGRTPARRVTSARPRPAIPARPSSHGVHHAGWRQRRQEFQRGIERIRPRAPSAIASRPPIRPAPRRRHQSGAAGVPTAYTDGAAIDFGGVSVVIRASRRTATLSMSRTFSRPTSMCSTRWTI